MKNSNFFLLFNLAEGPGVLKLFIIFHSLSEYKRTHFSSWFCVFCLVIWQIRIKFGLRVKNVKKCSVIMLYHLDPCHSHFAGLSWEMKFDLSIHNPRQASLKWFSAWQRVVHSRCACGQITFKRSFSYKLFPSHL